MSGITFGPSAKGGVPSSLSAVGHRRYKHTTSVMTFFIAVLISLTLLFTDGSTIGASNTGGGALHSFFASATYHETIWSEYLANIDAPVFDGRAKITTTQTANGATLFFWWGYQRGNDVLSLKYFGGASVTASFDAVYGRFRIVGTAGGDEYQKILNSILYRSNSRASNWRQIAWNFGADIFFDHHTGYYYQYISTVGRQPLSWTRARDDCASRRYFGLSGYLATFVRWREHWFATWISDYKSGWIGASDYRENNVWRWVTGPDGNQEGGAGRKFWYYICTDFPIYGYYYYWYLPEWFRNYFEYNFNFGYYAGQNFDYYYPNFWFYRWQCFWKYWYEMEYLWSWWKDYLGDWYFEWLYWYWFWYWWSFIMNHYCANGTWTQWYYDCKMVCSWLCQWQSGQPNTNPNMDYVAIVNRNYWRSTFNTDSVDGYYCEYGGMGVAPNFADLGWVYMRPSCQFHLDKKNCNYFVQCWWNPFLKKCVDNKCLAFGNAKTCRTDPSCDWDISEFYPNTCQVRYCFGGYTSENTCNEDDFCQWSNSDGVLGCHTKMCTVFTSGCACGRQPMCFYDATFAPNTPGKCIADTYALCPAADVIVAMQCATRSDGKDFDSQTNAMRRWIPTVSWTGTGYSATPANSQGLRAALFVWGKNAKTITYFNFGSPVKEMLPATYPKNKDPMTGVASQLMNEIVYFESVWNTIHYVNAMTGYVAPALSMGYNMLQFNIAGRSKNIIYLTRHNQFHDINDQMAKDPLNWFRANTRFVVGVTALLGATMEFTFGAVNPLKVYTTDATHGIRYLSNGVAIERSLQGLCTTGKDGWNKVVVTSTVRDGMCESKTTQARCDADDGCYWSNNQCLQSTCVSICTRDLCNANSRCEFKNGNCRQMICGQFKNQATCDQHFAGCRWEAMMSPAVCVTRPCVNHINENSCLNDPTSCIWDNSVNPTGNCRENKCNVNTKALCTSIKGDPCIWDTFVLPNKCREDLCKPYSNLTQVEMFKQCRDDSSCLIEENPKTKVLSCQEQWCSSYNDETKCFLDKQCMWDTTTSPSGCVETYCSRFETSDECHSGDRECEWDARYVDMQKEARNEPGAQGVCVGRRCWSDPTSCECMGHDTCFWAGETCRNHNWYNVTGTDLFVLLDGKSTMAGTFSGHPNGFVGMMHRLKEWIDIVPLTGTKSGQAASGVGRDGFRILFYQFGEAAVFTSPGITQPSGDRDELLRSLDWHVANYKKLSAGSTAQICPVVRQVIRDITATLPGAQKRERVMLLLLSTPLSDITGCATPLTQLNGYEVTTVAVAVLPGRDTVLTANLNTSITRMASEPRLTLAIKTTVDGLTGDVLNFLDDWAVDNEYIPGTVVTPENMDTYGTCQQFSDNMRMCMRDPYCDWADAQLCLHAKGCNNIDCKAALDARPYTPYTCGNCRLLNGFVDCQYNYNFPFQTAKKTCINHKCTWLCNKKDCYASNVGCTWNETTSQCQREVCSYAEEATCTLDWVCGWEWDEDPRHCRRNECTGFTDPTNCLSAVNETQTLCLWDVEAIDTPSASRISARWRISSTARPAPPASASGTTR